jgi:hypothetical protein
MTEDVACRPHHARDPPRRLAVTWRHPGEPGRRQRSGLAPTATAHWSLSTARLRAGDAQTTATAGRTSSTGSLRAAGGRRPRRRLLGGVAGVSPLWDAALPTVPCQRASRRSMSLAGRPRGRRPAQLGEFRPVDGAVRRTPIQPRWPTSGRKNRPGRAGTPAPGSPAHHRCGSRAVMAVGPQLRESFVAHEPRRHAVTPARSPRAGEADPRSRRPVIVAIAGTCLPGIRRRLVHRLADDAVSGVYRGSREPRTRA